MTKRLYKWSAKFIVYVDDPQVSELESVDEQIREFEVELGEIKAWMDKTRAHLSLRDDTLTLHDQLHMQEVSAHVQQL